MLKGLQFAWRGDIDLGSLLDRLAEVHGDRRLYTEAGGATATYREAHGRAARWAAAIAAQVDPDARVVVHVANRYDYLLLCLAVSAAGAVPVPVNPLMRPAEIAHVIADSGAALVLDEDAVARLETAAPVTAGFTSTAHGPDELAAIFYTSGTTGRPKGVRLSHRALVGAVRRGAAMPTGLRRDEAVVGLPVAHFMGFTVLLGLACAGVPVYFLPHFRPDEALTAIETRRATVFVGVPAMYRMMMDADALSHNLKSVRVWGSGADAMPPDLARQFQRMGASATLPLSGHSVGEALFIEGYGLVETGGGVAVHVRPPHAGGPFARPFAVPLPSYRMRVVDGAGRAVGAGAVGELQVKGPGVLEGYHGDRAATDAVRTADGWLRTGDLARRGPLGSVELVGREKDVVKVGGYSVYALEVQRALEEHPDVVEAVVLGVPDRRLGERCVAAVTVLDGTAPTNESLIAFAAERLSDYKVPSEIRIVPGFPRTATQKVQRDGLRPLFATDAVI